MSIRKFNVDSPLFHILFWVIYTVIWVFIGASYKNKFESAIYIELGYFPIRLIITYSNYFILYPKLLLKGKTKRYLIITILSLILAGFIQRIVNYHIGLQVKPESLDLGLWVPYKFIQTTVIITSPLVFLIGISLVAHFTKLQRRTKQLETEKLNTELKFLKSQINPHFLFNTLNTIYGLSLKKSDKVPKMILKLSDILSYTLYDSRVKWIALNKEMELIRSLIDIEKDRYGKRVSVNCAFNVSNELKEIPPLILIPFIENAFKHGVKGETNVCNVTIELESDDNKLIFRVNNSVPEIKHFEAQKTSGIGLENVTKRLDLIYENNYSLNINQQENSYEIELKIILK